MIATVIERINFYVWIWGLKSDPVDEAIQVKGLDSYRWQQRVFHLNSMMKRRDGVWDGMDDVRKLHAEIFKPAAADGVMQ